MPLVIVPEAYGSFPNDFIANFSYSRMRPVIYRITCNDIRLTFGMNSSMSLSLMSFSASFVMALQIAVIALSSSLLGLYMTLNNLGNSSDSLSIDILFVFTFYPLEYARKRF